MGETHQTVTAFDKRIESKDFYAVRRLLHDDLVFEGPSHRVDNADPFVDFLTKMLAMTERFDVKHVFVDGRITAIRAHFESQPWAALAGAQSG